MMDTRSMETITFLGAVLGVASHLGYFIRGEYHLQSTRILALFVFSPAILFFTILRYENNNSYFEAGKVTAIVTGSYTTTLVTSMLIYRAFFHPLRAFPGPLSLKLSKFSHVFYIAKKSRNYIFAGELFKQYGEFVRIGPNELITTSPQAVAAILGPGSKCSKSPWYDSVIYPNKSLNLERDRVAHDKRRKIWDRAFNVKALREYEGRVIGFTDELVAQLHANSGKAVNASRWFNFFAFDIMGDMAFSKSYDMLKTGEQHGMIKLLQEAMAPLGTLTPIDWILPLLQDLPGLSADVKKFLQYNKEKTTERKTYTPKYPDLFSYLINAEKQSDDPIYKDPRWFIGDCGLVIVAGSDTISTTLTHMFYHLARSPRIFAKLRAELDSFYKPGSETEFKDLQEATYLNGVINETLRLHPPTPSGLQRQTPPRGIIIGSIFIPGNVTISTPFYSLGRLESCYKDAEEFIPERWGEKPEMILNKAVFVPFSLGPFACVGKQLALMELRNVTARIMKEFKFEFAPGEDGSALLENSRDTFTMALEPLMLVFTKRTN
ncbi:hypothetical protein G7Y89_g11474 [Cudoniella acicularis]|uniref:Cytochrome P450 n=1 Tax=Cudoniella acicularis TaxID=354080 RepID=A0A8H4VY92_9HELO|nr:hypothetical protein G7Y89_g11474 [Cudoniella acicularis]